MAKMLKDEMQVIKSIMVEVDPNTVLLLTQQYHTEEGDNGKVDRSKSQYRWMGRIMEKDEVTKTIQWCLDDQNRLARWRWPNDKLSYYICINNGSECSNAGHWLLTKLHKLRPWDIGLKYFKGWKPQTKAKPEAYNTNWGYAVDNYVCDNGDVICLTDREAVLKHVGQNVTVPREMKSKLAPGEALA